MSIKRWRTVNAKQGEIKIAYGKDPDSKDVELQFCWGDGPGGLKQDSNLLIGHMHSMKNSSGKSLLQELEERGYDITTLKFSIQKKK